SEITSGFAIDFNHGCLLLLDQQRIAGRKRAGVAVPADVPVAARLEDGAITDINVMTRRKGLTHTMIRIDVDGSKAVPLPPSTCLLLCHR
ncbi:HutD family protein, partial [Rhizobium ruizarguesonis]